MIKILLTNSKGKTNITQLVPEITNSGDYQSCARTLEFSLASSYTDKNVPVVACELGNAVTFKQDNRTLFDGFIFERQKDTEGNTISLTCYDRGIYLKRNEAVRKFKNVTPEAITKRLCADFDIPVGFIATTGIKVTRNFVGTGTSLYKMIQAVYTLASEQTGKQYIARFNGAKLEVIEKAVTGETLIIEGGSNLMSAYVTESISNMINQVAIYNSDDKLIKTVNDVEAVRQYGLLQSYLKQPDKEDATAKAKKLLADNGVSQKITVNNLGNIANVTGGTVVVKEPYTGLYGLFYIDADVHTWKLGQYYNKLTLNFKSIMDEQEAGSLPNKSGSKTKDDDLAQWDYLYKPGGEKK